MFRLRAAFLSFICIICLSSCSTTYFVQKSDYNNPRYENTEIKRNDIQIVEVTDKRKATKKLPPDALGWAIMGGYSPNQYYKFSDPVPVFIEKSLNVILADTLHPASFQLPVSVTVDDFILSTSAGAFTVTAKTKLSLTFKYNDNYGIRTIKTSTIDEFSSAGSVTQRMQYLAYDAVYECARQFADSLSKTHPYISEKDKLDSVFSLDSREASRKRIFEEPKKKKELINYKKMLYTEYGLSYHSGSYIDGGGSFTIRGYINDEKKVFLHGLGIRYGINFVSNYEKSYGMDEYSLMYSPIFFLSESRNGIFFSGDAGLGYGSTNREGVSDWYFLPSAQVALGLKAGPVAIKGGPFVRFFVGSSFIKEPVPGYFLELSLFFN